MADKNFYCELCDCTLHSKNEFEQHCKGKKHISNEQLALERDANRKLFVRGHEGIRDPMIFLHTYFCNYGKVENISFGGRKGSGYAIVEFSDSESVAKALKVKHRTGARTLNVKQYHHQPSTWQLKNKLAHQKLEEDEKTKQARSKQEMIDILMLALSVGDQIDLVAQRLKLDTSDTNARNQICAELAKLFIPHFPNCTIHPFGSSVNGFGAKGCDLDLFLDLKSPETSAGSRSKVKKLGQVISASPHFTRAVTIPSQRCPLVKFAHKSTEIKCDLSINNRKALHNSYLLRLYSSEPRVHKLVSIIRLWARSQELASSAGTAHLFTSYSITLIVLFFVMRREPKIVPLVCDIEKYIQGTHREMVDDCECIHVPPDAQLPPSENKETDLELLKEFFTFYSNSIDWDRDALVLKDGRVFPRSSISLDPNYTGCKAASMTVLDPFAVTHNVVGNVNPKTKERFVQELKRAAQLVNKWPEVSPSSSPWGIAALLVPAPAQRASTPGKTSGHKAKITSNQGSNMGAPSKNSTTPIEGEQENGDFCITVQPLAKTMLCVELLSLAKQNNMKPAEQWCIMAQDLILRVLRSVFLVEVEEVAVEVKEEVTDMREEVCTNVNMTKQAKDELVSDVDSKCDNSLCEAEKCNNLLDLSRNSEMEHEGSYGKRTSDEAHLDSGTVQSIDDSTSDKDWLLKGRDLNPKKRFCEGVTGKNVEVTSDDQLIHTSDTVDVADISSVDKGQHSFSSVGILDDSRISFDDHYSKTVCDESKVLNRKSCAATEAVSATCGSKNSSATQNTSSEIHTSRTLTHSDSLSQVKKSSYYCRCKHQLWISRKKLASELPNKHALTALELEQEISNLALRKQHDLVLHQELSKTQVNVTQQVKPCCPLTQNDKDEKPEKVSSATAVQTSLNDSQRIPHLEIAFTCQIVHQNYDTELGLPHILIKLRPAESSSNQFKNFYCSFRALVLNLIMKYFLQIYKDTGSMQLSPSHVMRDSGGTM